MSNIITIENVRGYIDENGTAMFNAEDVARGWGFMESRNGKDYIMWRRLNKYLDKFNYFNSELSPQVGKSCSYAY